MIKFILIKFDKRLLFQILEQHHTTFSFTGSNFDIGSYAYPAISYIKNPNRLQIRLRGRDKHRDNNIIPIIFNDNYERDKIYNSIIESFKFLEKQENISAWKIKQSDTWGDLRQKVVDYSVEL